MSRMSNSWVRIAVLVFVFLAGFAEAAPAPDPVNVAVTGVTTSSISLGWASGGGSTAGFKVAYLAGTLAPASKCASGTVVNVGNVLSFTLSGLPAATRYTFRVCSYDSNGNVGRNGITASGVTASLPVASFQDAPAYDYGYVQASGISGKVYATLSFTNSSGGSLDLSTPPRFSISGTPSAVGAYTIESDTCPSSLSVGSSCSVTVSVYSSVAGNDSGSPGNEIRLKVFHQGIAQVGSIKLKARFFLEDALLVVTEGGNRCDSIIGGCEGLNTSAGAYDYGTLAPSTISTRTFIVTNQGPLAASGLSFNFANATNNSGDICPPTGSGAVFCRDAAHVASTCDDISTLASGGNCTLVIDFQGDPMDPTFTTRAAPLSVSAANAAALGFSVQGTVSNCPVNYLEIAANPALGTLGFCIAKYEMKDVGGVAASQPASAPWVNLTRVDAAAKCQALGSHYGLIGNAEWQAAAREIEAVQANWSNGSSSGNHYLNAGHTDAAPVGTLDAGDGTDPCVGTGNANCTNNANSDWSQKRTHLLASGQEIWDMGGNASEWISDTFSGTNGLNGPVSTYVWTANIPQASFGPLGNYSSKASGAYGNLGYITATSVSGNIQRGGYFNVLTGNRGVFSANLNLSAGSLFSGYRCVYRP